MDELGALLGLSGRETAALEPRDILRLSKAEQYRYNREALLVAWAVLMVSSLVPKMSKGSDWRSKAHSIKDLVRNFPPPGYVELEEPDGEHR